MSNSKGRWYICLAFSLSTQLVAGAEFDCSGAQKLVDILRKGPDGVIRIIERNPKRFVNRTIPGWQCVTDPFPPEKNGRTYLEGLECIYSDMKTPVSDKEISSAGEMYQKNLGEVVSCFPKNFDLLPTTFANTTGEGVMIAVGEEMDSEAGGRHQILLEYTYFQDSDSPLYWRIAAKIGSKSTDNPATFCTTLDTVINESSNGFKSLRGSYNSEFQEYSSTLNLPSARSCEIESDGDEYSYSCSWHISGNKNNADQFHAETHKRVSSCVENKIRRERSHTSDSGRQFLTYYLEDNRKKVRLTYGPIAGRSSNKGFTIRIYVEYDRT